MRACYGGCGRPIEALLLFCLPCMARVPHAQMERLESFPSVGSGKHMVHRARLMNEIRDDLSSRRRRKVA